MPLLRRVVIPTVLPHLSTEKVLTMELLEGAWMGIVKLCLFGSSIALL